jgi:hypothetical protein
MFNELFFDAIVFQNNNMLKKALSSGAIINNKCNKKHNVEPKVKYINFN